MAEGRDRLIDGWRGLSVLFVVVGHFVSYRSSEFWDVRPIHEVIGSPGLLLESLIIRLLSALGDTGVQFFFVISGFLITKLLDAEENRTGKVSIGGFYVRRVFRIMPSFYVYLLTILVLRSKGLILANDDAFFRSGLYVCNLSGFKCSWWLAHTWSLSVEEQFYLIWPLAFVALGRVRAPVIVCVLITLVIGSYSLQDLTGFAEIAIGALFAISVTARNWIARFATTGTILVAAAAIVLKPFAFPMPQISNVVNATMPLLTALVFFGTISKRGGPLLQIISTPLLQKIGLISYSVYLWQQLSLAPYSWNGIETGATRLYENHPAIMSLLFVPIAILSYLLVERPMIKIGHGLSDRIVDHSMKSQTEALRTDLSPANSAKNG